MVPLLDEVRGRVERIVTTSSYVGTPETAMEVMGTLAREILVLLEGEDTEGRAIDHWGGYVFHRTEFEGHEDSHRAVLYFPDRR